jgi:transposase
LTGALNLETAHIVYKTYDRLSAQSFIDFLETVQANYPKAPWIHLFLDNGSCHTAREVKEYLKREGVRIKLHYLPPYSPNLNPIERLWKIFHSHVSNNKYYAKGREFVSAVNYFFDTTIHTIKDKILSRCTDNFEVLYS